MCFELFEERQIDVYYRRIGDDIDNDEDNDDDDYSGGGGSIAAR